MADNLYAGASIQIFPNFPTGGLGTPHGDVADFLGYVGQFNAVNFHAKDDDVPEWRYNRKYDNFEDRLGIDSVRVFYHNGHSTTESSGRFIASMGRIWDKTWYATSSRMSPGDQRLRYLFWASCNSVRTTDGQNPWRTWNKANKGLRMIFGFNSLSWDEPGYAAGFFREWNTGKSFSQSWLDASLAIRTDQCPSVAACGATPAEAQDRLWNERLFHGAPVSDCWYWWRWAGNQPLIFEITLVAAKAPKLLELRHRRFDADSVAKLARKFGVRPILPALADPRVERRAEQIDFGPRLVTMPHGGYRLFLAEPDRFADACQPEAAAEIARRALKDLRIGGDVQFDGLTITQHAGRSSDGEKVKPQIDGFIAHFRQVVEGDRIVRGSEGGVSVTLDPSGRVCAISDSTLEVVGRLEARPVAHRELDLERRLDAAVDAERRRLECGEAEVAIVPNGRDFGYRVNGNTAVIVGRQEIEVTTGDFTIRRTVEVVW